MIEHIHLLDGVQVGPELGGLRERGGAGLPRDLSAKGRVNRIRSLVKSLSFHLPSLQCAKMCAFTLEEAAASF